MTPEEIRTTWQEAARRMSQLKAQEYENNYLQRKETALQSLAKRYGRFSRCSFLLILCVFCWLHMDLDFEADWMRYVIFGVMTAYFVACGCIDYYLYKGVSAINCYEMTVTEVIDRAMYYRKKHFQSLAFLLPIAIGLIAFLAYALRANEYVISGIICGSIVGLAVGLFNLHKFMAEYRKIKE